MAGRRDGVCREAREGIQPYEVRLHRQAGACVLARAIGDGGQGRKADTARVREATTGRQEKTGPPAVAARGVAARLPYLTREILKVTSTGLAAGVSCACVCSCCSRACCNRCSTACARR